MRLTLMLALCAGCAASTTNPPSNVRIVMKEPDIGRYKLVGRVVGVAPTDDLVSAGPSARRDIKRKAARMGAVLVKVDEVTPPEDKGHKHVIVLVGRAFSERLTEAPPVARKHADSDD